MNTLATDGELDSTLSPYFIGLPPTSLGYNVLFTGFVTHRAAALMLPSGYGYTTNSIDISTRIQASYFTTQAPATGTIPTWCNRIAVLGLGGGGGGGGAVGNFSPYNSAPGADGGVGQSVASPDNVVIAGGSPYSMTIGGGGAAGNGHPGSPANGRGNDGSPGGDTTITIGGVSYNALGGGGGGGTNDHTGPLGYRDANTLAAGTNRTPSSSPANFPATASYYGNRGSGGNVNSGGNGNAGNSGGAGVGWIWFKHQR
jgi:hypothetical protein